MQNPIIEMVDESVRGRIEANLLHYAPFLAMLTAWKQALEADLEAAEQRVMHRITSQYFPSGDYRFPAQTLAVPQESRLREYDQTYSLYDPRAGTEWVPSGRGWTLPTRLSNARVVRHQNQQMLILEFEITAPVFGQQLITHERGQLLFVAGSEGLLEELCHGTRWLVQQPHREPQNAVAERYDGFLEFERELAIARWTQRHLEAWLPSFYPYSRKFLHFRLSHNLEQTPPLPRLGECPSNSIRLIGLIAEPAAMLIQRSQWESMLFANAIPVIQASCLQQRLVDIPFEAGEHHKTTFAGIVNCICAIAYRDTHPLRAWFEVDAMPEQATPGGLLARRLGATVNVYCDTEATQVKIYFNTVGEEVPPPQFLETARDARFSVPFPPVGALDLSSDDAHGEGIHQRLYHSLLRPPMLTEGDIHEILRNTPAVQSLFDLSEMRIEVRIEDYPFLATRPWHNYLWPSVVSDTPLIERQIQSMAHSGVFITPVLRLVLPPRLTDTPRFLLEEGARYAASVISQFFQIGMYVVQGEVA